MRSSHISERSSHISVRSSHIYDGFYENKAISASIEVEVELSLVEAELGKNDIIGSAHSDIYFFLKFFP